MGAGGRKSVGAWQRMSFAEPSRRVNTVPAVAARGFPRLPKLSLGKAEALENRSARTAARVFVGNHPDTKKAIKRRKAEIL